MFKGILFDLDGVITDTAEFHFLAWNALGEKIGITFNKDFNENLKGVDRMESLERILKLGKKENAYTPEEKLALAKEKNDLYQTFIAKMTPANLLPGIAELLQDLKEHEIKIGLASASKNAPFILKQLEIADVFDIIVDPNTLEKGKPAPDIFLKGAQLLNLPVTDCVGVEDAYSGITAIKASNMLAIGVGDEKVLHEADAVVENTRLLTFDYLKNVWENQ